MNKEYDLKVTVAKKKRKTGMILAGILMVLCVIALMLSLYSFFNENIVFGISYIVAILLGLSYIVIKINQYFSTFVAVDGDTFVLRMWDNHFFPYNAWNGIPFIREFIPAKSEIVTIPMNEIRTLIIGTKSYVKRNAEDEAFNKEVLPYEKNKYSSVTGMLEKSNLLYIRVASGESCFMNVDGFDCKELMGAINRFTADCDEFVDVRINSRACKKYLKLPEFEQTKKSDSESEE